MKPFYIVIPTFVLSFIVLFANAQRQEIPFNKGWQFTGKAVSGKLVEKTVNVPHTWNATDAQKGISYYRGTGTYEKSFVAKDEWKEQRVFARFNGVMSIAEVYLNGELLGEHRGGYSAFIFELTNKHRFGGENHLKVVASNEATLDVLPLTGDFNLYGGMYRPVHL
ncbi:MAG: sugar-binding domain-containing protein, partial [Candidatus Bipolaricaulota bacterium]